MLFRGVIQSAVLVAAYTVYRRNGGTSSYDVGGSSYDASRSSSDALEAVDTRQALQQQGDQQQQAGPDSSSKPLIQLPFVVIAAIELGLWLFMATGMQVGGRARAVGGSVTGTPHAQVHGGVQQALGAGWYPAPRPPPYPIYSAPTADGGPAVDDCHAGGVPYPGHRPAHAAAGQLHGREAQPQCVAGLPGGAGGLPAHRRRPVGNRR